MSAGSDAECFPARTAAACWIQDPHPRSIRRRPPRPGSREAERRWQVIALDNDGHNDDGAVIPSQNALRRSTRFGGALPAMIAALMAPIEMPATQIDAMRPAEEE